MSPLGLPRRPSPIRSHYVPRSTDLRLALTASPSLMSRLRASHSNERPHVCAEARFALYAKSRHRARMDGRVRVRIRVSFCALGRKRVGPRACNVPVGLRNRPTMTGPRDGVGSVDPPHKALREGSRLKLCDNIRQVEGGGGQGQFANGVSKLCLS